MPPGPARGQQPGVVTAQLVGASAEGLKIVNNMAIGAVPAVQPAWNFVLLNESTEAGRSFDHDWVTNVNVYGNEWPGGDAGGGGAKGQNGLLSTRASMVITA
eukprot:SAG22_NODE_17457_length_304_cov_1.014634_1_plen_101_part_11